MSDETGNTGGNAQPNSAGDAATNQPAATSSDNDSKGFQGRIDQLTAQKNEWQNKYQSLESELAALREKNKTEQERAMDAYANQRLEQFKKEQLDPLTASVERMKVALTNQVNTYRDKVPEDKRPESFELLPIEQQLDAYRVLAESLTTARPQPTTTASNPQTDDRKIWKASEIKANNHDQKWWSENREEILAAQREGRIDMTA